VVRADGAVIGEVTSGNFSPILERGIALAFLPPDVEEGTEVAVDIRGRRVAATVVRTPFVHRDAERRRRGEDARRRYPAPPEPGPERPGAGGAKSGE
jgi:glycine cleavage system aminomethyltransferase T